MKIIDLLNKIANGEEVPKKFKIEGINRIFNYNNYEKWFDDINDKYYCKGTIELRELNDEVEILEEKKIPEKLSTWFSVELTQSDEENVDYVNTNFENMYEKINEICDYLDYLKSKGE